MKTKEEIIQDECAPLNSDLYSSQLKPQILNAMSIYAKQIAVDFLKWNASKVNEYVAFLRNYNSEDGVSNMEQEANWFEGSTIEGRFDKYLQEKDKV